MASDASVDELLSSHLASEDFSVAAYLNLALRDAAAISQATPASAANHHEDALQRRMAELALQLQLQTQSCHEDIGRIGAELQAILPRCAADVGRVGVGLEGMRIDSTALLETVVEESGDVAPADGSGGEGDGAGAGTDDSSTQPKQNQKQKQQHFDVSSSLETLSTLHALQSNLSRTKHVLTAAATWDTTLNSIPPLLAQQNLAEAVTALAKLEDGERALRGMPRPEDRKATIGKVRTQIQVLLQPQLKHALQNMSTRLAPLQQCVSLYTKLGTLDSLRDEYVKTRPQAIHKAWFSYAPSYATEDGPGAEAHDSVQSDSFVEWLPSWYDAVLSLLSEERRQSSSVFGAELAPQMLLKVLKECFRPILPSFRSRLEKIFSPSPEAPASGSFESVCAAYESTLRMLSMAYETVAGAYIDVVESGANTSGSTEMDGLSLYHELEAVILHVASPFEDYQKKFGQLEMTYTRISSQHVSKEMQQAVSSVSPSGIEQLQEAIEKLKDLAPFIFPMAESSFDRFELLNGGYMLSQALNAVDKLLSDHIGELIIAIRTLSVALTTDANQLADKFDEQHVLCAMEILKLAGSFRQDIETFEVKTQGRFGVLLERMSSHLATIEELDGVATGTATKRSSYVLPDSLSVVEIDSILTKVVCGGSDGTESNMAVSTLERLSADNSGDDIKALYPGSEEAFSRLITSCHIFVSDVCSAVPRKHLTGMSSMAVWTEAEVANNFDSYGTLPQSYITHVGEHMLALVQALEPFSSDPESLLLANRAMDSVQNIASPMWNEFVSAAGLLAPESASLLMDGKNIEDLVLSNAALDDEELDEETSEQDKASAAFCNVWLDAIGMAVTGRILERIMRIGKLSAKGCEHLSADLNYLVNVFSALGVAGHPHPLLSHLADLSVLGASELEDHIRRRDISPAEDALRAIEVQIATLRGIQVD